MFLLLMRRSAGSTGVSQRMGVCGLVVVEERWVSNAPRADPSSLVAWKFGLGSGCEGLRGREGCVESRAHTRCGELEGSSTGQMHLGITSAVGLLNVCL